jgi:DNA end-binding protein Ku
MQTVWKGTISFGLVSIPVRLVSATEERDVSFRQVRRSDGARVRYRRVAETDGEEVPYSEIAKGYELPDGEMVILDDDDLAELPVASSKAVDVLSFVPFEEIDPTALAKAYYVDPTGDEKPYVLLRDALEAAGQVAVVKVSLRSRERLAVLRPRDGVLVLQTMLWPDEVRRPETVAPSDDVSVRPQELAMAQQFVEAMSGSFDPGQYHDEYREALEALVQAKVDGREVTKAPEVAAESGAVVDLVEALRRSVAAAQARHEAVTAGGSAGSGQSDDAARRRAPTRTRAASSTAKSSGAPAAKKAASKQTGSRKATAKKTTTRKAAARTTAPPEAKSA